MRHAAEARDRLRSDGMGRLPQAMSFWAQWGNAQSIARDVSPSRSSTLSPIVSSPGFGSGPINHHRKGRRVSEGDQRRANRQVGGRGGNQSGRWPRGGVGPRVMARARVQAGFLSVPMPMRGECPPALPISGVSTRARKPGSHYHDGRLGGRVAERWELVPLVAS
jgi:hypothetical protein